MKWFTKAKLVKELRHDKEALESKVDELQKDRKMLKEQVEDLKIKKKIEEEDIKHMVKMKEEALEIEFKKRGMDLEQAKEKAIAIVKDEYRDKMEIRLVKEGENIKEMYGEILKRLPDVNVRLKGDV